MIPYNTKSIFMVLIIGLVGFLQACGGGSTSSPPGTLSGVVATGNSAIGLSGVSVIVFDASTNAPAGSTVQTSSTGSYTFSLNAGSYYVKLYKQGYNPVPASALLTPVPLTVASGATTNNDVLMTLSALTNIGWITGTVTSGATGAGGVLVAAEATGGVAYTSFTDSSGNYAIYNVPASTTAYTMKAYIKGYSFTAPTATVTADTETTSNLSVTTTNASATVPVKFNLIAGGGVTDPANMMVSLVHPVTKETIPGQSLTQVFSSSLEYSFSGVADGNYIVRATFANDTIVVDPDAIVKSGEPSVAVASAVPMPNPVLIKATRSVDLVNPTNALSSTVPVDVVGTTPTFTWKAYSSTDNYVIEVMNASTGTVIWGGIAGSGATATRNIVIPKTELSIVYDADTKAAAPLVMGKTYRWRIYASKNQNTTPDWSLISMSEDQTGLITIR